MKFTTKDLAIIALSGAFWSVINATIAPIIWKMTHLPFFCDLLAVIALVFGVWWVRKPGAGILVGLVATLLNFVFRPGAFHFFGFTVASVVFDILTYIIGYERCFVKRAGPILVIVLSAISTWVAGVVIGSFFMGGRVPVLIFSLLHAIGGIIGGVLSVIIIKSLEIRGIKP